MKNWLMVVVTSEGLYSSEAKPAQGARYDQVGENYF
jgi:hypothetical protein